MANAPAAYRLDDRYLANEGRVFLTGIQALARIPIDQLRRDRAAGLRTAAFVSGYPGSPLGGFDQEVARAAALASDLPIVCRPGVNEELGATAVMGSQLASGRDDRRYDGVLGIWYGKAPGLDRAGDALRHANFAGTGRHSGAIVLVGDDPAAKSSTLPSSSDATLVDLHMPVIYPGDVQEVVELSRHAVAISRASGLYTAMKIVAAVADGTSTVDLEPHLALPVIPTLEIDGKPWECHPDGKHLLTPYSREVEREFREIRLELAARYAAANDLNRVTVDPPDAWIGLVASGFTYHETLAALRRLGLGDERALRDAGIRLFQMQMPVPFDASKVRRFARGLDEIVVVEEKNPTLELMIKDALYGGPEQPRIVGKTHPDGRTLMRSFGQLDADAMLEGLRERLSARLETRLAPLHPPLQRDPGRKLIPLEVARTPYFCSGCPHNWSTKVPDGALVGAGIGCHGMTLLMDTERVGESFGLAAMGGEGVQWVGMEPFVGKDHAFQNLGDGTFFHSGQLAIQAAVAAGSHITYKLLYNGTVAMTGGQDAQGAVGVPEVVTILLAHGVAQVLVTTDDPGRYRGVELPGGVQVWDRTRIVEAQELLARVPGVTVLIHDQACAAQTRRLRKRGRATTPDRRVVINHRICEGCGDCGDVSNCLSVQPIDTPFGRKTTIDQASCNLDFSCLEGDCPSFMTVQSADRQAPRSGLAASLGRAAGGIRARLGSGPATRAAAVGAIEDPPPAAVDRVAVRMVGIGGTGVVTVAQILGTAAMADGWNVRGLDQTGLSQKAGPVTSDVRMWRDREPLSNLLGSGEADTVLAFDLLAAVGESPLGAASAEGTVVIGSTSRTPTGPMVADPSTPYPDASQLQARLDARSRAEANRWVDAAGLCRRLLGDPAPANIFLLGVACQSGAVPVAPAHLAEAIELNGVAVAANLAALDWGRRWAVDPAGVERVAAERAAELSTDGPSVEVAALSGALKVRTASIAAGAPSGSDLGALLELMTGDLVGFQDERYARRYLDHVERVRAAEAAADPGSWALTEAAARGLHKVMAYKDEYEVARLLIGPEGRAAAEAVAGPGARATWRLHPPLLKALGMDGKLALPAGATAPAMRLLAHGKRLRTTPFDPFGRTAIRRLERRLVDDYESLLVRLVEGLDATNVAEAAEIAGLIDQVRGYEDLKARRAAEYQAEVDERLAAWRARGASPASGG